MYIISIITVIFMLCGNIFSNNYDNKENEVRNKNNINKNLNYLDVLMEDLLNRKWEKDESICFNKLLNIITNVKNSTLWAMWVWDSMQTPAGLLYGTQLNLGNFDQCMNLPWLDTHPEFRTQYCLADIQLSEEDPKNSIGDPYKSVTYHINSVTKHQLKFNRITWGICIPAECKIKSTSKFVRSLFKYTHLGSGSYKINVHHCQVAGIVESSKGNYFVMIFFITIFFVTVICTIRHSDKLTNNDTIGNKLLRAFSLMTNTFYLDKLSKDDIKVLHGLRVLTSFTVVSLHVALFSHIIGFSNSLTLDEDLDRLNLKATLRADYSVDIFLLMSGLLRIKSFLAVGKVNPFKAILKRYLRYIVMMAVSIFCVINIHNNIGDGPVWPVKVFEESKACEKNWFITVLMLGNYIDTDNICYPVMWTVACDFHLSVIATILYWIFEKNQKMGFITFAILTMASILTPGIVNYYQNSPIISAFDFILAGDHKKVFLNRSYMLSHLRGGPYFIGIALGYLMTIFKPDKYRNIFSKLTSLIGILLAITTAFAIISFGVSLQNKTDHGVLTSFVFISLHRSIWTLAITCIIIICEYGTVPLLGTVLNWSFFIPLSKISYCIYLVHIGICCIMTASTRSPLHYSASLLVIHSLAVISISCMASVILYLFVEAPTNRIIDIMIDIKADTKHKNESKTTSEFKNGVMNNNDAKKNI